MKRFTLLFITIALCIISYSQTQTILHVNVNDMVYDNTRNKIFAIIHSADTQYGNKLLQIDCDSKSIDKSLFVGSDPKLIDITHDNQYLYISLDGAPKIVRVGIEEFKIDSQFPIGPMGDYVDVKATSIETVPNNNELLAVCRLGDYNEDLVLFESGTLLADSFGIYYVDIDEIETDSSGLFLYGADGDEFFRFDITSTGITKIDEYDGVLSGGGTNMIYHNGLIYTSNGDIINPHTSIPFIEGQLTGIESNKMAINKLKMESYFGAFDFWSESFRVRRYNLATYTLKDIKEFDLIFPETMSDPELSEFICYANDKFVLSAYESYFSEDNEKYIVFIDDIYSTTTSVAQKSNQMDKVLIYPNPVSEYLHVDLGQNSSECKIEISNINGQIIYSETVSDFNKAEINVSDYISGVYLIRIVADNYVINKQIVIE